MAQLDELINTRLIKLDLKRKDKDAVIEQLADLLNREHKLSSKAAYVKSVYEREAVSSTYCGSEVAIPHAMSVAVREPAVCFGRSEGLYWGSPDEPVRFVFLIAVPSEGCDDRYIAILSAIAQLCLDEEIRDAWAKATTAREILTSIQGKVGIAENDH